MNNVRNILTDIENSLIKQVEIDKKMVQSLFLCD